MTLHLGDVPASSTIYIPFHTFDSNGASITLTGLAVTDIEIYKNGSTTQRASDNGYALLDTDGIDFDGITGLHGFSVDLSDNSDASFYAVGSFYWIVVSAVTIDTRTVSFVAATFRIRPAESVTGYPLVDTQKWLGGAIPAVNVTGIPKVDVTHLLGTAWLTPGTAGTPDVNVKLWNGLTTVALPLVPTTAGRTLDVSATGEAGIDWANVGSPTTVVGLSGTTVKTATDVETDTQDIQARLPAALTADGNIKADALRLGGTAQTGRDIGASVLLSSGTGTGQVKLSSGYVAPNWGDVGNPTTTVGLTGTTIAWNASWDAEVESEVNDALVGQNLDHLVKIAVDTNFATTVHADSVIGQIADNGAGFDRTTDSLEAIRDRGDAAWLTATGFSTHSAADVWAVATRILTAGTNIALAKGTGVTGFTDIDAAGVRAAVGLASANLDTQIADLPTNTELATALAAADDAVLAAIAALNNLSAAQVNAEIVDALSVDTYSEPGQGAPAATAALTTKIGFLYKAWRNRTTQTATEYALYADNGTTKDQEASVSDDSTTFERGEIGTGA